jgi:hypothetical protein
VIEDVKSKLTELKSSLPPGVEVVTTYDRSDLIDRSIDTLRHTSIEELIIVSVVILIFLWHVPSAIIRLSTFDSCDRRLHPYRARTVLSFNARLVFRRQGRANQHNPGQTSGGSPELPILFSCGLEI